METKTRLLTQLLYPETEAQLRTRMPGVTTPLADLLETGLITKTGESKNLETGEVQPLYRRRTS